MNRRQLIMSGSIGVGVLLTGCIGDTENSPETAGPSGPDRRGVSEENLSDAPSFEVDEAAPGKFMLLRHQPQTSSTIRIGEEYEIAAVLGNAGGEEVHGEVEFTLESPAGEATTETLTVPATEALPPGGARYYLVGPFSFDTDGEWSFTATAGVARVHSEYDETISVETPGS